ENPPGRTVVIQNLIISRRAQLNIHSRNTSLAPFNDCSSAASTAWSLSSASPVRVWQSQRSSSAEAAKSARKLLLSHFSSFEFHFIGPTPYFRFATAVPVPSVLLRLLQSPQ